MRSYFLERRFGTTIRPADHAKLTFRVCDDAGVDTVAGHKSVCRSRSFRDVDLPDVGARTLFGTSRQTRICQAHRNANLTQVVAARSLRRPQAFASNCASGEHRVEVVELQGFARLYGKLLDFVAN